MASGATYVVLPTAWVAVDMTGANALVGQNVGSGKVAVYVGSVPPDNNSRGFIVPGKTMFRLLKESADGVYVKTAERNAQNGEVYVLVAASPSVNFELGAQWL